MSALPMRQNGNGNVAFASNNPNLASGGGNGPPPDLVSLPKTGPVQISRVEELPASVQSRINEVLHPVEDSGMRDDARLLNFLAEVEEGQALAALNEYYSAVSETSVQIRNKPAYLMGILRKYKQGQRAPVAGGRGVGMGSDNSRNASGRMGGGLDGLPPNISNRLENLFATGFVLRSEVDQRCLDFFRDLTHMEAESAMDEFSQSDIGTIRNKSAFLMSILRKHHQQQGPGGPSAGGGGGAPYGGGRPGGPDIGHY
ncbi:unnamed protein product, partial [Discosporangium mesarthrocarpum]